MISRALQIRPVNAKIAHGSNRSAREQPQCQTTRAKRKWDGANASWIPERLSVAGRGNLA